jgi:hypothetical protein
VKLKESYALALLSAFVLGTACRDTTSPPMRVLGVSPGNGWVVATGRGGSDSSALRVVP